MRFSSVLLTSYEAIVLLDPLDFSPLELSLLELRQLTRTHLEGTTLELDHLWGLVLYLVYVSGLAILYHEANITLELVYWGVSRITDAFWIPEMLAPTTHHQG